MRVLIVGILCLVLSYAAVEFKVESFKPAEQENLLNGINKARWMVFNTTQPLIWSEKLAQRARNNAKRCAPNPNSGTPAIIERFFAIGGTKAFSGFKVPPRMNLWFRYNETLLTGANEVGCAYANEAMVWTSRSRDVRTGHRQCTFCQFGKSE